MYRHRQDFNWTKKKGCTLLFGMFILSFPNMLYAAKIGDLIDSFTDVISLFIPILLGIAVLVFFWGLVKFINHAGDEKTTEEGKQLMVWGMIAIFVIFTLWGIIGFVQEQLGLDAGTSLGTLPASPDKIPVPSAL